jgi:ppGpp synthetase/RelA/SpoT-type nucleotidyltranferase
MSKQKESHPPKEKIVRDDSAASIELTDGQLGKIQRDYEAAEGRHKSLLDEVVFILTERLRKSEIKVHAVEHRVKTLDSVVGKCRRDSIANFGDLNDVVGA